jgi:putative ABC transport system permease protein
MIVLSRLKALARWVFRRKAVEKEIDNELNSFVEAFAADKVRNGETIEEGRRLAKLEIRGIDQTKERIRSVGWSARLEQIWRDLHHGFRFIGRQPGFAAAAILTLALGIGGTTALFAVVNSILLRPLPYFEPDRIVSVWTRFVPSSGYDIPQMVLSWPEYVDFRTQAKTVSDGAVFLRGGVNFSLSAEGGEPLNVQQAVGTASLFNVLGNRAAIGRTFFPGDDQPGAACVAVLSHGLWTDVFGGDRGAVGRSIHVEGPTGRTSCEIVGVMPQSFVFPDAQTRMWRNLVVNPSSPIWQRLNHNLQAIARLTPGVTLEAADEEVRTLMAGWESAFQDHYRGHFVFLRPFINDVVGGVRDGLVMLLGAGALLLLIVCGNLASLLLARGENRRREMGVRMALGAARSRLVLHQLMESLALALTGSALGVTVAVFLLDVLVSLYPGTLPRGETVAVDWRVLAFAVATTALATLLFGLLPAIRSALASPGSALQADSRTVTGRVRRTRLMRCLVVVEIALSVSLVTGAVLLLRSYENLRRVDLGLDANNVYVFSLALPASAYPNSGGVRGLYSSLLERIEGLPSVSSAGAVSNLPLVGGTGPYDDFIIEGRPKPGPGQARWSAGYVMVMPGYFETLRIPVVAGRSIERGDHRDALWVAVINEEAARIYWPNENPIGRRLGYGLPNAAEPSRWITIVGIVKTTLANGAQEASRPQIFVPHAQMPREPYPGRFMTVAVRASGDPLALPVALRDVVREADSRLPMLNGRPMEDVVSESMGQPRFTSMLVTFFGIVALLIGSFGIHGVLAYSVAQRSRELGIRLALGATPVVVLREVVGEGMRLASIGIALGMAGSLAGARLVQGLLFGVTATDPLSFSLAFAVLGVAALMACYGPGRRASRIDPVVMLRVD